MKRILPLIVVFAAFNASALSKKVDELVVNVNFEISKCALDCDDESSVGTDVVIPMDYCTVSEDVETCLGHWAQLRTRDGYQFWADMVVKKTTRGGESTFELTATVGPVRDAYKPASLTVFLGNEPSLATAVKLAGLSVHTQDATYESSLLIQPVKEQN